MSPRRSSPRRSPARRAAVPAAVLSVLAALLSVPAAAAPPAPAAGSAPATGAAAGPAGSGTPAGSTAVTLLTGDRVHVTTGADGRIQARFLPVDPNSAGHLTRTVGRDLHVVPDAAAPLLASGRLDPALFNVSALLRQGLDDTATTHIPLIATYRDGTRSAARAVPPGAVLTRTLPSVDGGALRARKADARTVWRALTSPGHPAGRGLEKIWLDARVRSTLDESVPYVGAPAAWLAGHDGAGTTVAVLDSGVDAGHPDLAGAVAEQRNFTDSPDAADRHGHGTHVSSTVLGRGTASAGRNKGVAPGARLLSGKVLNDYGMGELSWIIAGMEWAVAEGADVVNMSIGTDEPVDCTDPMVAALNHLSDTSDTLFVVSAGNLGGPAEMLSSPGCARAALTVAATDLAGVTADFSSRGPVMGSLAVKPDIAAPGVAITAARAGGRGDAAYTDMRGTSMAAPHVAGAAAILAQQHPDWDGERLKAVLQSTVRADASGGIHEQGAGILDVAAAASATVTGPGTVDLGTFAWPHLPADTVTRDLVYTNTGSAPATLQFTVDARGDNGKPLPDKAFTLGARRLTVPAGGSAALPVTVVPSTPLDLGLYGSVAIRIVATAGDGRTVVTPVGFHLEPQHVDVTFRMLDRHGAPVDNYQSSLDVYDMDSLSAQLIFFEGGDRTLRLRAGTYSLAATVGTTDATGRLESIAFLAEPELTITGDRTVTFDARTASRSTVHTERPVVPLGGSLGYGRVVDDWVLTSQRVFGGTVEGVYLGRTATARRGTFEVVEGWKLGSPAGAGQPYQYSLAFPHTRQVTGPFTHRVSDSRLATIDADYHTPGDAYTYSEFTDVYRPWSLFLIDTGPRIQRAAPSRMLHLVPADPDTRVGQMVGHADAMHWSFSTLMRSVPRTYRPGSRHHETWFRAGLRPGPAHRIDGSIIVPAGRLGNDIWCNLAGWADTQPGHDSLPGFLDLGTTELFADGTSLGLYDYKGAGEWTVPARAADYELVYRLFRSPLAGPFWQTPTQAETRWRFRSEAGTTAQLPLLFPDYDLDVDGHDRAPRVAAYPVSIGLDGAPWYQPGGITAAKAWVSHDDGATWTAVPVHQQGDRRVATVDNTAAPEGTFVSLRIELTDAHGVGVTQTVTRLYAVA